MKMNTHALGMAGSITVGIWYTVIALFIKIWPEWSFKFLAMAHMITNNVQAMTPYMNITVTSFLIGITLHLLFSYIFFWLIAAVYNYFAR